MADLVGSRVRVYWEADSTHYAGQVITYKQKEGIQYNVKCEPSAGCGSEHPARFAPRRC